jgi:hypothetical protein
VWVLFDLGSAQVRGGNLSLGNVDAQEKDRRVTVFFSR